MMKLRIRSLETKETQRIEVPNPCTLRQLKNSIFLTFSSPASSSSSLPPPDSIHLSLNRKDEIQSDYPDEDTLQSVGLASGDLIFFTLNPNAFSSQTLIANSQQREQPNRVMTRKVEIPVIPPEPSSDLSEKVDLPLKKEVNLPAEACDEPESSKSGVQNEELMEVDAADDEGYALETAGSSFSVPGFLKKVFTAELGGGDDGGNHKLLVLAIHAVLLESGFVGFDMDSKTEIKGFQFRENWPPNVFFLSLFYTLPGIIRKVFPSSQYQNGVIVLKFQYTGNFLNVYGSLYSGSKSTHLVRLNEESLVPFLNVAWANCGLGERIASKDGKSSTSPGTEVFNFWRIVKDELALPLLIDLCDKAGLVLPPCFMRLPTELKLKILESLTGDDIAKVSCVCSELRYLASNDDLWKLKFVEKFGDVVRYPGERGNWKEKFARRWQSRNKRIASGFPYGRAQRVVFGPRRFPRRPGVIGGDYDLLPQINFLPFNQVGHRPSRTMHQSHIPPSNGNGHL